MNCLDVPWLVKKTVTFMIWIKDKMERFACEQKQYHQCILSLRECERLHASMEPHDGKKYIRQHRCTYASP